MECGAELPRDAAFCEECGTKVEGVSPAETPSSAEAAGEANVGTVAGASALVKLNGSSEKAQAKQYAKSAFQYGQNGQYAEAIAEYGKAIALDPNNADNYGILACYHEKLSQFDAAIDAYTKAISIKPDTSYYTGRAGVYGKAGDFQNAIADFNRALAIYAAAFIYERRGDLYMQTGDYAAAVKDYTQAVNLEGRGKNAKTYKAKLE
jgi:tetratricopeptide (TPR) repeat protein